MVFGIGRKKPRPLPVQKSFAKWQWTKVTAESEAAKRTATAEAARRTTVSEAAKRTIAVEAAKRAALKERGKITWGQAGRAAMQKPPKLAKMEAEERAEADARDAARRQRAREKA
ncbi:MAG TPA: hypothetical protein VI977_02030 [archaeon]|nr:hypothetical protein [archaeon]